MKKVKVIKKYNYIAFIPDIIIKITTPLTTNTKNEPSNSTKTKS